MTDKNKEEQPVSQKNEIMQNETVQKVTSRLQKISKKTWAIIALVVIVIIAGTYFYNNRKLSALTGDAATIKFTGYDGSGVAVYNETAVYKNMLNIMTKKAGLDEATVNRLNNGEGSTTYFGGNSTDPADSDAFTSEQKDKIIKVEQWGKETKLDVDPTSNLKNGDKVTVKVSVEDDKTNPVKAETKTFTVKGLKSVQTKSTSTVLSDVKADFVGFNGYGTIILNSKKLRSGTTFTVPKNGKLSNGQTVTVKAPDSLFEQTGVKYSGKHSLSFKVTGLNDLSKITNIDAVKKVSDSIIKDKFDDDHHTITFLNMYAFPNSYDSGNGYDSYTSDSSVRSEVEINDHTVKKISNNKVMIVALYQTQYEDDGDKNKPEYSVVKIDGLKDRNNTLNIDEINTEDKASTHSLSKSLTTIQHNLAADGIKLK